MYKRRRKKSTRQFCYGLVRRICIDAVIYTDGNIGFDNAANGNAYADPDINRNADTDAVSDPNTNTNTDAVANADAFSDSAGCCSERDHNLRRHSG